MMKDFFLFETELPEGSGFPLFGVCHRLWLLALLVIICISGRWYGKQSGRRQERINHIMGVIFPLIAVYRDTVLVLTGHFARGFLPFHLCSMALWIAAFYCWKPSRFLGVVYLLLCVPGAVGALLFPNWDAYPFFNYMHIHGFISHGLIVAFGIWLFLGKRVVPGWNDFWMPVVFGIAGFILLPPLNRFLGTNFWFLNRPSHGSPLVGIFHITGEEWYMAGYFLFCMVIVAVWQGMLGIFSRLVWREKKQGNLH
ncbi:MAG: YwaF family protein [Bacteroidales bacterium]|nr:YwaF family protein [Clostridium sp.]MCM1202512.1 YwaF family protein [Bacteroidales bacterium]